MMKTCKRILSVFLSLLLALPTFSGLVISASAVGEAASRGECGDEGDNLIWELTDDGTLTIIGSGKMRDYKTYPQNPFSPFSCRSDVKKLVIGEGVTHIGNNAFYRSVGVTHVSLPSTLRSIGHSAFHECGITQIDLPEGLKTIGNSAFAMCAGISCIHIPASVVDLGSDWPEIREFTVDEANRKYTAVDGVLFTKDMKELCAYPGGKSDDRYVIPDGTERIGRCAFNFTGWLTMVYVPLSVTELGEASLLFGGKIYYAGTKDQWNALIDGRASVCYFDMPVYFSVTGSPAAFRPDSPIARGECGVDGGNVSWTLTRDGALTFTGAGAMGAPTVAVPGADEPVSIFTPGALAENEYCIAAALGYASAADAMQALGIGMITQKDYYDTITALTLRPVRKIVVGDGITAMKDGALRGACADSISLPQSLTEIGDHVFAHTHIEEIALPANLTQIGEYAFADSTLYQLTVESGSLTAAPTAFENAYHLRYIIINNDGLDFSGLPLPCGAEGFAFKKASDFNRYAAYRKISAMLPLMPTILDLAAGTEARIKDIMRGEGVGASAARAIDRAQTARAVSAGLAFTNITASIGVETLAAHCRNYIRSAIGLDIQSASDIYTPDGRFTDSVVKAFGISYGVDLTDTGANGGDVFYAPVRDLLLLKEERGQTAAPWLTVKANCGSTPHAICVAAELPFESLSHAFGDWETDVPAGEHTAGQKERVCVCGKTQRNVIPAIGRHLWGPWSVTRPATETQDGECVRVCKNPDCGEVETAVFPAGSEMPEDLVPEAREDSTQKSIIQFFLKLVNFFKKLFSKK